MTQQLEDTKWEKTSLPSHWQQQ